MKVKTGFESVLAYLLWVVTLGLGAWLVIISRNTLEAFLGWYFIQEKNRFILTQQARLLDIVIPVVLWLLWFVMLILVEEYYRRGVEKHTLFKRFMKMIGVLLILIFFADLLFNLMLGFRVSGWLRWLITLIELLAGAALWMAGKTKPARLASKTPPA
jgi:hypothetical protein